MEIDTTGVKFVRTNRAHGGMQYLLGLGCWNAWAKLLAAFGLAPVLGFSNQDGPLRLRRRRGQWGPFALWWRGRCQCRGVADCEFQT